MKTNATILIIQLAFFVTMPLFAVTQDGSGTFSFDATQLLALLNPVVAWLVIQGVKLIGKINSTVILAILVPGLSLLGAYLLSLLAPDVNFWFALVIGFLATFIRELQKALTA